MLVCILRLFGTNTTGIDGNLQVRGISQWHIAGVGIDVDDTATGGGALVLHHSRHALVVRSIVQFTSIRQNNHPIYASPLLKSQTACEGVHCSLKR